MAKVTTEASPLHALISRLLTKQVTATKKPAESKRALQAGRRLNADDDTDRRKTSRKAYSHWQLMAPFDGKKEPPQADFRLVLCHDVSPRGFSFSCEKPPRQKRLIIALGTAPFTFFEAEIVRRDQDFADPVSGWRLGCRFVRKLQTHEFLDAIEG